MTKPKVKTGKGRAAAPRDTVEARLDPNVPPRGLSARAGRLWKSINTEFELEQSQLAILEAALFNYDRFLGARDEIDRKGITITSMRSHQVHANPAVKIEEAAWRSFVRGIEMLDLDYDLKDKRGPGRPPAGYNT